MRRLTTEGDHETVERLHEAAPGASQGPLSALMNRLSQIHALSLCISASETSKLA